MREDIYQKLGSTFYFIKQYYWPVFVISMPILIFIEVSNVILDRTFRENVSIFYLLNLSFGVILNGLLGAILIYIIHSIHYKNSFTITEISNFVIQNIVYVSLSLFIINLVTRIGIIFLVFPGIYLLTRLAITPYLICLDNAQFINSFRLSWEYSKKYIWPVFFSILIIALPAFILIIIQFYLESQLAISIISVLIGSNVIIGYILIFYFYLDIKSHMIQIFENQN